MDNPAIMLKLESLDRRSLQTTGSALNNKFLRAKYPKNLQRIEFVYPDALSPLIRRF